MQLDLLKIRDTFNPDCETKVCSKCGLNLPLTSFSPHGGGNYLRTECKKCAQKLSKERKLLRDTTPPPPKDYKCPICLKSEEECAGRGNKKNGAWVLDHNHETGKFRGYLCHDCNRGLGNFGDSVDTMKLAIDYLLKNGVK